MAEDWITVQDAVKQSGYNANHLRVLIREGKIKARKFAIVWQVNRKSLESFLIEQAKRGEKRGRKPLT
jgi:hypothetical protein